MTLFEIPASETGVVTSDLTEPAGRGPLRYLREAGRTVRFDDRAMARMANDPLALRYGASITALFATLVSVVSLLAASRAADAEPLEWSDIIVGTIIAVIAQMLMSALNVALIHGMAKWLFGATGTYLGVLRVLWLGSIVLWLFAVPVLGPLVGGVWFLLVFLVTFETVDGVERLQALGLMAGFTLISLVLRTLV